MLQLNHFSFNDMMEMVIEGELLECECINNSPGNLYFAVIVSVKHISLLRYSFNTHSFDSYNIYPPQKLLLSSIYNQFPEKKKGFWQYPGIGAGLLGEWGRDGSSPCP
jgi:hypothetical protein